MSLDGNNILVKILRLLNEDNELRFVNDQVGSPTFTLDLVDTTMRLIESEVTGVVHVTNSGSTSWDRSMVVTRASELGSMIVFVALALKAPSEGHCFAI